MVLEEHHWIAQACRWLVPVGLTLASFGCASHPAQPAAPRPMRDLGPPPAPIPTPSQASSHSLETTDAAADSMLEPSNSNSVPKKEQVIDLATALELGGANSLRAELAREQLAEARARLDQAEVLWLPNLWAGVSYNKQEGALQETEGKVLTVSRNSGFAGGGLFASFDLADALLEPESALHEVEAANADVTRSVNDGLLGIALAHNDLLAAQAGLTLADENQSLAAELTQLAEAFSGTGQGLEADAARARSELARRAQHTLAAQLTLETRAARLSTLLRLEPGSVLRASEPGLIPLSLLSEEWELSELIDLALRSRPELRASRAIVQAKEAREKQERLRPFIPRLQLGLRAGGLGGGTGSDFKDFSEQGDFSASLVWGLRNLGLGESVARRREAARSRSARVQLQLTLDAVSEQVTVAYLQARTGRRQVELAAQNVEQAQRSLDLNMQRIQAAEGLPIEALQAIIATASAKEAYLDTVLEFNRSQLHLLRAIGRTPQSRQP